MKDIAKEAGVSTATVSYIINKRSDQVIAPQTIKKSGRGHQAFGLCSQPGRSRPGFETLSSAWSPDPTDREGDKTDVLQLFLWLLSLQL